MPKWYVGNLGGNTTILWMLEREGPPWFMLAATIHQVTIGIEQIPELSIVTLLVGIRSGPGVEERRFVTLDTRTLPTATAALEAAAEMKARYLDAGWASMDEDDGGEAATTT